MIIAGHEIPVYQQHGIRNGSSNAGGDEAPPTMFSYLEFTLAFTIATFVLEYYLDWY